MRLLDAMIQTNRLREFVAEIIKLYNEEQEDKTIWELWLHKVFDESFTDFKKKLKLGTVQSAPKKEEIEKTVKDSFAMLNGFEPDGVHGNDGTVSTDGNGGH